MSMEAKRKGPISLSLCIVYNETRDDSMNETMKRMLKRPVMRKKRAVSQVSNEVHVESQARVHGALLAGSAGLQREVRQQIRDDTHAGEDDAPDVTRFR